MNVCHVLDREHFSHMTGDDAEVQAEIIALFQAQAQLWSRLLIPDAPLHTWSDTAHTCKGAARGLGLWRLAQACEAAEAVAQSGDIEGPRVSAALRDVRAALREALDALALSDEVAH